MKYEEFYPVTGGAQPQEQAVRYWAMEGRLLVGGRINDASDGLHLRDRYGVTHVLSAESEQGDEGRLPPSIVAARYSFVDDGQEPERETVLSAARFALATLRTPGTVLYTHCRLGGSRGPAYAYMSMRLLGMPVDDAMERSGRRQQCGCDVHTSYVKVIEWAVAEALR